MQHYNFIKAADNKNSPIIGIDDPILPKTYFNLIKLEKSRSYNYLLGKYESLIVILSGVVDIVTEEAEYSKIGKRKDIWSGRAEAVYVGAGTGAKITAVSDNAEVAVAGGKCDKKFPSFNVTPKEVEVVEVGSKETHSRRRIYHILGQNGKGRAGNLLVSELYADEGCWSGYPPHKHDTDNYPDETNFEEVYHYRFNPVTGFGGQFCYRDNSENSGFLTRNGDTFAFRAGYHPTVTSPGHSGYIFTILVGDSTRSLIQNFKEEHRHLMGKIPGIGDMTNKFK